MRCKCKYFATEEVNMRNTNFRLRLFTMIIIAILFERDWMVLQYTNQSSKIHMSL